MIFLTPKQWQLLQLLNKEPRFSTQPLEGVKVSVVAAALVRHGLAVYRKLGRLGKLIEITDDGRRFVQGVE